MRYYSRKMNLPFQEVLARVTRNLQAQGFGVITTIDVKDTFKQKLDVNFRNYKILGACNPQFAYQAISLESHLGTMMPCNVVVQEHENGLVEISAANPLENIDPALHTVPIQNLAQEASKRLRAAIDDLQRDESETHEEALPSGNESQMHGHS